MKQCVCFSLSAVAMGDARHRYEIYRLSVALKRRPGVMLLPLGRTRE